MRMKKAKHLGIFAAVLTSTFALTGCNGGGGGGGTGDDGGDTGPAMTYHIGGTLNNLPSGTTLVLQNNSGDNLSLSSSGDFVFSAALADTASYNITIASQPAQAACTISNGSGAVAAADVTSVRVDCVSTAITNSTTSSTAFAVLATDTSRIAFIPVAGGVLPLNIAGNASPSAATKISRAVSPSAVAPVTTLSFTPDSCTVDSRAMIVSCMSYHDNKVAFLDVSTFANSENVADITAREFSVDVPDASIRFSGVSCEICGIVAIPEQGQFAISASDGYRIYSYPSATATSPLVADKVYAMDISENFVVDPSRKWLITAQYDTTADQTRELRVINLANDHVYIWSHHTDQCDTDDVDACNQFKYEEVDAAAIDVDTGMVALQSESGNEQLLVDLGQAVFDDVTSTFDAPHVYVDVSNPYYAEMSGILASPDGNWLFVVPEFSSAYISVQHLPQVAGSAGSFPVYAANPVFVDLNALQTSPCSNSLRSGFDPHTQGYTTNMAGRPTGIFVDYDKTCVVTIDLESLYNSTRSADDARLIDGSVDLVGSSVITFIKVPE